MPKAEPFEELDSEVIERAVVVFTAWARAQSDQRKPILEFLDGSTLTPGDLLVEPPPGRRRPESLLRLGQRVVRQRLASRQARSWPRLLNLVAVSAIHGDENIDEMLTEFEIAAGIPTPMRAE